MTDELKAAGLRWLGGTIHCKPGCELPVALLERVLRARLAVQARSLLPLLDGRAERLHDLVVTSVGLSQAEGGTTKIVDDSQRRIAELSPSTIRTAEWDFLYAAQGEPVELYRAADRKNTEELSAQEPVALAEMHAKYLRWLEGLGAPEGVLAARQAL